jgi:protein-L-isoaspartate O-methyltransferase
LLGTGWLTALTAVPRSLYAPKIADPCGDLTPDGPDPDAYRAALAATGDLTTTTPDGSAVAWAPPLGFAALLARLRLRPHHRVLVIGARAGYEAAVIAANPAGVDVVTCEAVPAVGAEAASRIGAAFSPARVEIADAHYRLPVGSWDRIVVTGTTGHIPGLWIRALSPGGRLLVSIGQTLAIVDRDHKSFSARGRFEALPAPFGPWDHPSESGGPLLTTHGADGFDLFAFLPGPSTARPGVDPRCAPTEGCDTTLSLRYGAHVALGRPGLDRFTLTVLRGRTLVTLADTAGASLKIWDLTASATATKPARRVA